MMKNSRPSTVVSRHRNSGFGAMTPARVRDAQHGEFLRAA